MTAAIPASHSHCGFHPPQLHPFLKLGADRPRTEPPRLPATGCREPTQASYTTTAQSGPYSSTKNRLPDKAIHQPCGEAGPCSLASILPRVTGTPFRLW